MLLIAHTRLVALAAVAVALTSCRDVGAPRDAAPAPPHGLVSTVGSGIGVDAFGRSTVGPFDIHSDYNGFKVDLVSRKPADVEVLQLTIDPGGTTGWHSHPGPVFVIVTAGALTVYEVGQADQAGQAEENPCTPKVYPAGTGFVETGGRVHVARNDGSVPAKLFATSIAPVGVDTFIDAPQPRDCPF